MQSLDDVLEGKSETIEATDDEGSTNPEPEQSAQPEPTGEQAAPPADETPDKPDESPESVPRAALQDERRKRQELQRQLDALANQKPQTEKPDFWADPEKAFGDLKAEMGQLVQGAILGVYEGQARGRHTDFDERMDTFADMVRNDPTLYQRMLTAPDPAEFAYQSAKTSEEINAAGNIDNYRAQVEAEVRQKLEAEYNDKFGQVLNERIPPSLSNTRAAGSNRPEWTGPPSLDNILK